MNRIFQIISTSTQSILHVFCFGVRYIGKNVVFWGCVHLADCLFQPWLMFILYDNGVPIWKFLCKYYVLGVVSLDVMLKGCLSVYIIHLLD